MTGAVFVTEKKSSVARCEGEHLVCSPCGKVAGREQCHHLAGPEVLLSLLPIINLGLYPGFKNFQFGGRINPSVIATIRVSAAGPEVRGNEAGQSDRPWRLQWLQFVEF